MTRQVRCMRDAAEKFKVDNVLKCALCAHAILYNLSRVDNVLNVHYVLNVHNVYILCAHATLFNLTRDTANVFSVARHVYT